MAESGSKLIHQMTFALMRVSVSRFTKCHAPKVTSCLAVPAFSLQFPPPPLPWPGQTVHIFESVFGFLSSSLCQSVCLSSLAQLWRQSRLPSPPPPPLLSLVQLSTCIKNCVKICVQQLQKKKKKKRSCRTFWSAISACGNGRHVQRQRRRRRPKAGNTFFFVSSPFSPPIELVVPFYVVAAAAGKACMWVCVCE